MARAEFGIDSELSLPEDIMDHQIGRPPEQPLDDPTAAMRAALADPLDFPPLNQCVIPGDSVSIVLGESVMQPELLVAGAVHELTDAGVDPSSISIVRHRDDARTTRRCPTRTLPETVRPAIRVVVHDPRDREQLSMVGVSSQDKPIYFNRAIAEADFVLPIGVARPRESLAYLGPRSVLFPSFTDRDTQRRFFRPRSVRRDKLRRKRMAEVDEAMWMLGVRLMAQVVAGPNGKIMQVVAGDMGAAETESWQVCDAVWRCEVPYRASAVVATLPGGREQQTWTNLARALDSALRVVQDDGTIAVCCDVQSKPGKSLRRLRNAHSIEQVLQTVDREGTADAIAAAKIAEALLHANVYLLSRLDEDCVHSLGLAYIQNADEVRRLIERHDSCILLQNAHQAVPVVAAEVSS